MNDILFVVFLAVAAGSLLYVLVQLIKVSTRQGPAELIMWEIVAGLGEPSARRGGDCQQQGQLGVDGQLGPRGQSGQLQSLSIDGTFFQVLQWSGRLSEARSRRASLNGFVRPMPRLLA